MDWKTALINQQHQQELLRQAERERTARAIRRQTTSQRRAMPLRHLAAQLWTAAQRLRPRPATDTTAPRVYAPAKQR